MDVFRSKQSGKSVTVDTIPENSIPEEPDDHNPKADHDQSPKKAVGFKTSSGDRYANESEMHKGEFHARQRRRSRYIFYWTIY